MALAVDDGLRQAADAIKARGQWSNTLVVYVNDNGGAHQAGSPNDPLRGGKTMMLEGGIHVRAAIGGGVCRSGRLLIVPCDRCALLKRRGCVHGI